MSMEANSTPSNPAKVLDRLAKLIAALEPLAALMPLVSFAARLLPKLLARRTSFESYETLGLRLELDIRDTRGHRARLQRAQDVRFLAEEAGVVRDVVWGEGDVMAGYRALGAQRVAVRREGAKRVVWLGLPDRPARGEVASVCTSRTIINGFTEGSEYLEVEVERPTRRVQVTVSFPAARPPKGGYVATSPPTLPKQRLRVRYDRGARPYLRWDGAKPSPGVKYRLCWSW